MRLCDRLRFCGRFENLMGCATLAFLKRKIRPEICVGVFFAGAAAAILQAGDEGPKFRDLKLPIERYDDGSVRSQIVAGSAVVPPDGKVTASAVRLEFYGRDGKIEALMTTDSCELDREGGRISSSAEVRLERSGFVLTGSGFEFDARDQLVKVFENVRVELDRPLRIKAPEQGETGRASPGEAKPAGGKDSR